MVIDMGRARAARAIRDELVAARAVAAAAGNLLLCEHIDAALLSLAREDLAPPAPRFPSPGGTDAGE
jgi:hypothetical protein